MPQFPINWAPEFDFASDEENRKISKLKLNDEWAIVIVATVVQYCGYAINSIEIHRIHTAGEFSISGDLTIKLNDMELWKQMFSRFIKTGSSFTEIVSTKEFNNCTGYTYWMHGHVNITENSKKYPTGLTNGESKEKIQLQSLEELSNDFKRLLEPKGSSFADVIVKCGGASIPAHKNILSARSPVFAAMFAHPMKESRENEVDITDIDVSILRALLTYIYTGKTSDLTVSSAADLLFAADKYQLQDLKRVCSYFLKDTMSLQNALKILVSGDIHAEDLKCFALEYICNNCAEFSVLEKTEEWKTLQKERPALAMDVLISLVKSKEEK
ncbi:Speckle-type POZ protein-like B [Araneus ventricosus]|uniref:Speckle-type POZ protein-like B n=1 Tax=Araneus ventricosus TaxID=182803 RepID=A0A4Y2EW91_ARAVE|nr:Speckle-type POZ protein-like B [Araneus ventricosus]